MSESQDCSRWCVKIGAIIGVVIALLAYLLTGFGFLMAIILGLIGFGLGYWLLKTFYCNDVSEPVAPQAVAHTKPAPAAAPTPAADPAPAAAPLAAAATTTAAPSQAAATSGGNWTDAVSADSGKAGASRGATGLKPAVVLTEEETLRDGVGAWKYESGATAYKASSAPSASSAPASAAVAEGDYDGDGVVEGKDEGEKPMTLSAAREGGADDLKQIKGVGPKMESLLNSLGFFHFDQVASWSDQEVAWVDANLEGFKGRVSRDSWVDQAKVLASGGETEFSKRVEDGGVY